MYKMRLKPFTLRVAIVHLKNSRAVGRVNGWRPLVAACLASWICFGCATMHEKERLEKFGPTAYLYEKMISESKFDVALAFQGEPKSGEKLPDFEDLKSIKVFAYNVLGVYPSADKRRINQLVEIRYFRVNNMVVKSVQDRQVWIYDEVDARWYLQSHLPQFR
jgi:hypothetical protein